MWAMRTGRNFCGGPPPFEKLGRKKGVGGSTRLGPLIPATDVDRSSFRAGHGRQQTMNLLRRV